MSFQSITFASEIDAGSEKREKMISLLMKSEDGAKGKLFFGHTAYSESAGN